MLMYLSDKRIFYVFFVFLYFFIILFYFFYWQIFFYYFYVYVFIFSFYKNKIFVHLMNVKKNTFDGLQHVDKIQFSLYSNFFTLSFDNNDLLKFFFDVSIFILSTVLYESCTEDVASLQNASTNMLVSQETVSFVMHYSLNKNRPLKSIL